MEYFITNKNNTPLETKELPEHMTFCKESLIINKLKGDYSTFTTEPLAIILPNNNFKIKMQALLKSYFAALIDFLE